jgi:hypothetical protein
MADQTPGGEWKWPVIFERGDQYEEVLVEQLLVNVQSFSSDDDMLNVGPSIIWPITACFASKTASASSTRSDG